MATTTRSISSRRSIAPRATSEAESLVQDFITAGIDDLAKYRILRLLCEDPLTFEDTAYYAGYLGFHWLETTTALLEELVAAGILAKEHGQDAQRACYHLVDNVQVHRHLVWLYGDTDGPGERHDLLQALAYRSLKKAQDRAIATERRVRAAERAAK